jgi:hypothetical protein
MRLRVCWKGMSVMMICVRLPSLLNSCASADDDLAPTGTVAFEDALTTANHAAGRKIRAGDDFHELFDGDLRLVNEADQGIADLAEIVRWNTGSHADGDTIGTVDDQVREPAGQHGGFEPTTIVIGYHVHGVFVEVVEHFGSDG